MVNQIKTKITYATIIIITILIIGSLTIAIDTKNHNYALSTPILLAILIIIKQTIINQQTKNNNGDWN